jgi:hypothetical protein
VSETPFARTPIVILVEPQLAENIGMTARAMANFGLSELRLVAPRDGWPRKGAKSAASGAGQILDTATLYDTARGAVADLQLVFATTARERGQMKRVLGPEAAIAEAGAALAAGRGRRHPVRPRAGRPRQRRDRAGRCYPHLSGRSRLRLPQPRAGGAARRLRVAQGRGRGAAVRRRARGALRASATGDALVAFSSSSRPNSTSSGTSPRTSGR